MPQQLHIAGGTLEVTEDGPADGPAVVLVHGYSVDETLWAPIVPALVAAGLRVLRPTLPIGSHRVPFGRALGPRQVAGLVADLLEHLDLRDVTLVGNDSGGAICQLLIDERPERVGRLVLTNCDTAGNFPPFPFDLLFLRVSKVPGLLHATLRLGRRTGLSAWLFGMLVSGPLDKAVLDRWTRRYFDDPAIRRETDGFLRAVDPSELDAADARLDRFEGPVRFVWGTDDRFFTLAHARRTAARFRDAEVVEVPGARTFVMLDAPERVAAAIASFVPVPA
jgi:pimeloyl-ACP methyl ester carboxylesterase